MNNAVFRRIGLFAAIAGTIGVILGAFGAHALKSKLEVSDLEVFKTGVLYLHIHTLAALLVSQLGMQAAGNRGLKAAGICFLIGIALFSGSIFLLSTASLTGFPKTVIGPVTPIGGLFFIAGWVFLLTHFLKK